MNKTVTVTSQSFGPSAGGNVTAYEGEPLAYVAGTNQDFDIIKNGQFFAGRSTGANSEVFVFNTEGADASATWEFDNDAAKGTIGAGGRNSVTLRQLGLDITADSTDLTSNDNVTGTISARQSGRDINVMLMEDGDVMASDTVNIDSDGEVTYDLGTTDAGNYTVVAEDQNTGNTVETDTISVQSVSTEISFVNSVVTEQNGDVAEINVSLEGGATEATVQVGEEDVGFNYTVDATDENGDGNIVIEWDTAKSMQDNGGLKVTGKDTGTITKNEGVSDQVDSGEYALSIVADDGEELDLATVILEERSNTDLTTHTAPGGMDNANDEDYSAIVDAASSAEQGNTIAVSSNQQDYVILRLSASGLEGNVTAASDLNAANTDFSVFVQQDDATVDQNKDPIQVTADQMTLVTTDEEDVYYLVFDSDVVASAADSYDEAVGDQYNVYFDDDETDESDIPANAELSASFELVEGTTSFSTDAGQLFLPASTDAEITGTSTWAPGTEFRVTTRSQGGTAPFVKTNQGVTVESDGTWNTTFDLSEQPDGQTFTAELVANGETVTVDGQIGQLSASVSMADQTAQDAGTLVEVTVNAVSNGGFVAIHRESASGPVIGASDYLEAGETGTVEIRLREAISGQTTLVAMAHKDTDGDRTFDFVASEGEDDGPYTNADGSPVIDSATVSIPTPTPTASPEPTDSPTPEPTDSPTPEPTDSPTPEPTEPPSTPSPTPTTSPGFGLIVALLALAGAALLARRRE